MVMVLGNYKNNYDIANNTAQWALTPKQLSLVFNRNKEYGSVMQWSGPSVLVCLLS